MKNARIIDDLRRDFDLSAGFVFIQNKRFQLGAAGIDPGGHAGAAGTDDNQIIKVLHRKLKLTDQIEARLEGLGSGSPLGGANLIAMRGDELSRLDLA